MTATHERKVLILKPSAGPPPESTSGGPNSGQLEEPSKHAPWTMRPRINRVLGGKPNIEKKQE